MGCHSENGGSDRWWDSLSDRFVRTQIQDWIILFPNQLDFQWNEEPHFKGMIWFHCKSGQFITRILGRTWTKGSLNGPEELVSIGQNLVEQQVCWGIGPPCYQAKKLEDDPSLNLSFSPECSMIVEQCDLEEARIIHPQCQACRSMDKCQVSWDLDSDSPNPEELCKPDDFLEAIEGDVPDLFQGAPLKLSKESPIKSKTKENKSKQQKANRSISRNKQEDSKDGTFSCPICQKEYGFLNSFRDHMRLIHLKGQFKCIHCDPVTILDFPSEVASHYQTAHKSLPSEFQIHCPNCKDLMDFSEDSNSLAVHYQYCVKESKKRAGLRYQQKIKSKFKTTTKPAFVCDECGKKYASARSLEYHIKLHKGQDMISCPQCPYQTPNPHVMKLHSKKHLREEGLLSKVVCDLCGMELRDNGSLKLHMATQHDSSKPLSSTCHHCHKTFATKTVMLRHIQRMHDTSEAFKCDTCGKGFSTSILLLEHSQRNHRPPSFKCSFCAKMLSSKDSLKCHERIHTGEHPFRCHLCAYTCKSSSSLSLHRKFVHNEAKNLTDDPLKPNHPCSLID